MKAKILVGMMLVVGSLFWSCQNEEILVLPEETLQLKSGMPGYVPICDPIAYDLIAGQNLVVGKMKVSNNANILNVEFEAKELLKFSEVQLWVGTNINNVPMNKNKIPLPGKFTYKAENLDEYCFSIQLSDIYEIPEMLLEGKPIFLFAHLKVKNINDDEYESAWSDGITLDSQRWGTYSEFSCCHPEGGGGGCFPHIAYGGIEIDGIKYYDNMEKGRQIITADIGEIIGDVENDKGILKFNFDQDWMFTDLASPEVIITGYYSPGEDGIEIYSGAPLSPTPPIFYYCPVSYYNYYKIELNVQYCY